MKKKIVLVVGTRPNFMKAYPIYAVLKEKYEQYDVFIIHTGQHFDNNMSYSIYYQLGFPKPDVVFQLSAKTKAGDLDHSLYMNNSEYLKNKEQVIKDLVSTDKFLGQLGEIRDKVLHQLKEVKPNLLIVFGDVTSTLAAAIAGHILNIPIAHVESGLRSFDLAMPEEVNRILTDYITNYYFVTETSGVENLLKEGVISNVYLVGNTMIDSLMIFSSAIDQIKYYQKLNLAEKSYVLITLHRPSNVDNIDKLSKIIAELCLLEELIIFPIHPRTKNNMTTGEMLCPNLVLIDPLPYMEFISLVSTAKYVITDSGGIQEETSALGIPCFTLRENTERPSTLLENGGTNTLISSILSIKDLPRLPSDKSDKEVCCELAHQLLERKSNSASAKIYSIINSLK